MELESKLAAYRAKKRKEARINELKEKFKNFITWDKTDAKDEPEQEELLDDSEESETETLEETVADVSKQNEIPEEDSFNYIKLGLIFVVWVTFYIIFIKLEFGIIFLLVSAIFGMYYNTRTGPRDANEVSAYSVFNKNCESIDGTLKAEQFEKEIRFGALNVH